ncbi:unnamed protein product, partial [Rangifer tarandus platyrhynchus]
MALPRLLGSPRAAAAALPGAGPEGLAPFRPPALPLSSRPRPAPGLAGRAERRALGTQLRRGGDRRLLCDVSSLRGYLYPHDWISFMKPGPVCLCARVRVAKVPPFLRRPWGVGAGSEADCRGLTCAEPGRPQPRSLVAGRGGAERAVASPPRPPPRPRSPAPHPFAYNCRPFVPGSGKV